LIFHDLISSFLAVVNSPHTGKPALTGKPPRQNSFRQFVISLKKAFSKIAGDTSTLNEHQQAVRR
jgi:hypothetical protein